jgi:multiple sugar transport system ATP-binding protein
VSLARALVRSPHAFLMDEPLSNLDASLRASMRAEIKQLVSALGITTVYVTHDQIEAMSMADRIGVMSGGEMIQVGRPLQVYDNPRTRFVAEFLGSPPMNLFPAELGGDGRAVAQPQSFADLLPAEQRELAVDLAARGRGFFVGVRPEHLSLVDRHVPHAVSAEVEFVEPLGQTTSLHLQSGSTQFLLITGRTSVTAGEKVAVIAAADHVRVIEASKSARDKG